MLELFCLDWPLNLTVSNVYEALSQVCIYRKNNSLDCGAIPDCRHPLQLWTRDLRLRGQITQMDLEMINQIILTKKAEKKKPKTEVNSIPFSIYTQKFHYPFIC